MIQASGHKDIAGEQQPSCKSAQLFLTGLLELLTKLHAKHVDLYLHQQGLDTSTPSGKAMFQMMGVFAEFERSMVRERVLAGM
jgi:DNA invertase Pin-like site-specific DNA recombinase